MLSEFLNATSASTAVEANVPIAVKAFREFIETGRFDSFKLLSHKHNLERASRGEKLSGPKISEYSDAVFGNENAIPVDRHIAQIMFGIDSPNSSHIAAAKRRIVQIGLRLGWTPRQTQAALWAANQKRKVHVELSYESYLQKFKKQISDAIESDTAGRGREASRRIASRISQGRSVKGGNPKEFSTRLMPSDADYMAAVEKG